MQFMRNALAHAGKSGRRVVSAFTATAFAQNDAEADVFAYMSFPAQHQAKLHSTNPLERVNGEVKRRTEVVGVFPNEAAIRRLVGAILLAQIDVYGPPLPCKSFLGRQRHRRLRSCIRLVDAATWPLALMVSAVKRPGKWTSSRRLASFQGPLPNPGCPGPPSSFASLASRRRWRAAPVPSGSHDRRRMPICLTPSQYGPERAGRLVRNGTLIADRTYGRDAIRAAVAERGAWTEHSAQYHPQGWLRLQRLGLQTAKTGRALPQAHQAAPQPRHPIRPLAPQLPRSPQARRGPHLICRNMCPHPRAQPGVSSVRSTAGNRSGSMAGQSRTRVSSSSLTARKQPRREGPRSRPPPWVEVLGDLCHAAEKAEPPLRRRSGRAD